MSEDLKSQEEKDNDIYRTFASVLLENGEYNCEHEMLKGWKIEDRFRWEEEFLPVSMQRGQKEKEMYRKMDFWKEMEKIKAKNRKEYEKTVCRYCKHSHWHADKGGEGVRIEFSCQRFGKIEFPVPYCSDSKIVE